MASEGDFAAIPTITREVARHPHRFPRPRQARRHRSAARAIAVCRSARIHVFLASSDLHLEYKLKISRQQALDQTAESVRLARTFVDDVEFSPEDATRSDRDFLVEMVTRRHRSRSHHHQHARHGRLHHARRIRRHVPRSARAHSRHRQKASSSPRTATTTSAWPWPIRWPPSRPARARWSAPSTASASAPATPLSKRSRPPSYVRRDQLRRTPPTSSSTSSTPPARCSGSSSASAARPTRPSSAPMPSRTSRASTSTACWPIPLTYEIMTPDLGRRFEDQPGARQALRPRAPCAIAWSSLGYTLTRDELQTGLLPLCRLADRKKTIYDQDLIGILRPTRFASGATNRSGTGLRPCTRARGSAAPRYPRTTYGL